MRIERGSRVAFARRWLDLTGLRYQLLTGRAFPLNETHQGTVEWVDSLACDPGPRTRRHTRVGVTWTDGEHRWFNVLPISALRAVKR